MQREHLLFALQGIKFMDDRIANPCYGLLLVTGSAQVVMSGRSWREPWIEAALGLYVALVLLGIFGYAPSLKAQIALVREGTTEGLAYVSAEGRQTLFGVALIVVVAAIVALMVFRPGGA